MGVLTSWDDGVLLITRRTGERIRIEESSLVAGKVVPAAPARRRGPAASYEELARVSARAWQPVEREPLGEWELRAAAGFTRRANSVLPVGDPGRPLDEALTAVRAWYAARGLPAYMQPATGAEGTQELLCAELEQRGWAREVTAELWTGSLAPVADLDAPGADRVALSRTADEAWLSRYQRKGLSGVALEVLGNGPSVWFATVPGAPGEPPAAIGRCVVDGRWAGFAAVEVTPSRRRRGLATTVMSALAHQALTEGASAAWLQVELDNTAARALYTGLGFGAHHAYHHYRGPEGVGGEAGAGAGSAAEGDTGAGAKGGARTGAAGPEASREAVPGAIREEERKAGHEAGAETNAGARTATAPEAGQRPNHEAWREAQPEAETLPEERPRAGSGTGASTAAETDARAEAGAGAGARVRARAEAGTETNARAEAGARVRARAEAGAEARVRARAEARAGVGTEARAGVGVRVWGGVRPYRSV